MAEEDLGSLSGGLEDPETTADAPPGGPQGVPVKSQPINQATMACLRGPCVHLWRLVLRFEEAVKEEGVMRERAWTCLASRSKEFDLNDKTVYYCDRWWPRAGLRDDDGVELVPVSRPTPELQDEQRSTLHRVWEQTLRDGLGYDFSWRDFDPEHNVDDDPHQRKFSAPGGLEAAREAKAQEGLPPAGSIPEDDDA